MHYSVCVPAVFAGTPIAEALPKIKSAGFDTFEFWSWWDQDIDAIEQSMREAGMTCAAMCAKMIPLTVPSKRDNFVEGVKASIEVAQRLGCDKLIAQVGSDQKHMTREAQHNSIVEGLKCCAPHLESANVTLVIEPLNLLVDHIGYYLGSSAEANDIVNEVGSPRVRFLFDIYHQQINEGNLIANLTKYKDNISHLHIAGNPGRHEPFINSEVDYPAVLNALKSLGWRGAVGLEYFPKNDPVEGLKFIAENWKL